MTAFYLAAFFALLVVVGIASILIIERIQYQRRVEEWQQDARARRQQSLQEGKV